MKTGYVSEDGVFEGGNTFMDGRLRFRWKGELGRQG